MPIMAQSLAPSPIARILPLLPELRGFHSSTSQLNVNTFQGHIGQFQ
jgi:hypothetical protein